MRPVPCALAMLFATAVPLQAHPHVFIDTGIEVVFDGQGRAEALRIRWTYDAFFSLSIIGDRGFDTDGDDRLTPKELAALSGFDMNWDPGFAGDTYALLGESDLSLSRPEGWTADYAGQKITSTHLRRFASPVVLDGKPLIVQVYDPGFYTAYALAYDPVVTGAAGCAAQAYTPDLDAAAQELKDALAEYSASESLEADFPAIGKSYAEEVRVTCTAR